MAFASGKRQPTRTFLLWRGIRVARQRGSGWPGEREMAYRKERKETGLRTVSQGSDLQVPL
jgi:hypothetical protein